MRFADALEEECILLSYTESMKIICGIRQEFKCILLETVFVSWFQPHIYAYCILFCVNLSKEISYAKTEIVHLRCENTLLKFVLRNFIIHIDNNAIINCI